MFYDNIGDTGIELQRWPVDLILWVKIFVSYVHIHCMYTLLCVLGIKRSCTGVNLQV